MRRHRWVVAGAIWAALVSGHALAASPVSTDAPTGTGRAILSTRPLYYERAIERNDLYDRTLRELTLMRNWIYARAGNVFRKRWLREYFENQGWYRATGLDETRLTELDRKNAKSISDYELSISAYELRQRMEAMLARNGGKGSVSSWAAEDKIERKLLRVAIGGSMTRIEGEPEEPSPLEDTEQLNDLVQVEQLADMSRRDLRLLRNTIYARRGRPFRSPIVRGYFERMSWYRPDPTYSDARLTATDNKNVKIILGVEASFGGPMTDADESPKRDRNDQLFAGP